jgi:hypothetical protein
VLFSFLFGVRWLTCVFHINYNIRNSLIQEIENYYPDFSQLDSIAKLKIILNPSQDILSNVVDYNFAKRKILLYVFPGV